MTGPGQASDSGPPAPATQKRRTPPRTPAEAKKPVPMYGERRTGDSRYTTPGGSPITYGLRKATRVPSYFPIEQALEAAEMTNE